MPGEKLYSVATLTWELRLLWVVISLYTLSFLLHLLHGFVPKRFGRVALGVLYITAFFHTGLIIFRTFEGARLPFQTLYETLSWFSWTNLVTYLYVQRKFSNVYLPGLVIAGLSTFAMLLGVRSSSIEIAPVFPALQSYWYEPHVITAFAAYAVIVVSCSIELSYLLMRRFNPYSMNEHSLRAFHGLSHKLVMVGFPLLTFGILSGAAWANEAWGQYWQWDPKETASLLTWVIFAMYLHAMRIPGWREAPASVLNLLGFLSMLVTFIGINYLVRLFNLYSLHAYG